MIKKHLTKSKEIGIKTWINETPISDSNWEVFLNVEDNEIVILVKDDKSKNELKINIIKYENTEENVS